MGDCRVCGQWHLSSKEFAAALRKALEARDAVVHVLDGVGVGATPIVAATPEDAIDAMRLPVKPEVWIHVAPASGRACNGYHEVEVLARTRDPEVWACTARM